MITIQKSENYNFINYILKTSSLFEEMIDDSVTEETTIKYSNYDYILIAYLNNVICGITFFRHITGICVLGDIGILPEFRKKYSLDIGREFIKWMYSNTKIKKIIGFTPFCRIEAKKFVEKLGFKEVGKISNSAQINGNVVGHWILEL